MDEELSAELLERADRDQAARMSLRPGHRMEDWDTVVEPVDRDNTARLREIVGRHGWPGHRLVGEAGGHAAWLLIQHAPPDLQEQCHFPGRETTARSAERSLSRTAAVSRVRGVSPPR